MNPLRPPKLRDDLPRYPETLQLVRVTGDTVPGPGGGGSAAAGSGNIPPSVLYLAYTQQLRTDTIAPRDREPCLATDVTNTGLTAGYYLGRLAQSFNSLPVYEVVPGTSGGSSTLTTINVDNTDRLIPTTKIVADNDLGSAMFGRIHFLSLPGTTTTNLDWQGQRVYLGNSSIYVGPEPDLQFLGGSCPGGSGNTISVAVDNNPALKTIDVKMTTLGMTGSQVVVVGGSFNSTTCVMTLTTLTMVINCGLIQSIS